MGSYRVEFKGSTERDLRRISPALIDNILKRIEALSDDPTPRQSVKLSGSERTCRLRVGDYRVIYEIDSEAKAVVIYHIRHRREAYRR
ncbi:MAG: type II toxin-antitoxin system RelE/ParE family toxin [Chloroflexi bacterium]|nr:type II toxin-antitoxin system RelE/ParE family toxin [Chloroflexota bacterium]